MKKTLTFEWDLSNSEEADDLDYSNYEMENIIYGRQFRHTLQALDEFLRGRVKWCDETPPKDWQDVSDQIWQEVLCHLPERIGEL